MYKPTKRNMSIANIDTQFNMLFWWVRYYAIKYFGNWWSKPIITCPTCMASIHSIYFYFPFVYYFSELNLITALIYIPYAFALSGMNTLVTSIIDND